MKTLSVLFTFALLIGASTLAGRLQAAHALPGERTQSASSPTPTHGHHFQIAQH